MNVIMSFDNCKICNHGKRKRLSDICVDFIRHSIPCNIRYSYVRGQVVLHFVFWYFRVVSFDLLVDRQTDH